MPCRPDLATSDSWPPLGKVVTQGFGTMASRELGLSSILPFDLEIDNIPWQIGQTGVLAQKRWCVVSARALLGPDRLE